MVNVLVVCCVCACVLREQLASHLRVACVLRACCVRVACVLRACCVQDVPRICVYVGVGVCVCVCVCVSWQVTISVVIRTMHM